MPKITRRATLAAAIAPVVLAPDVLMRPALAQAAPATRGRPLFGATLWSLPNGLRVAHVEQRRAPVVAQYLFVAAGGGEDPSGLSGTAHFLEHMMFKGSPRVESGAFSRQIAREGGNDNAFTSRDVTAYFAQVEASRLPLIAMLESDRLTAPIIPAGEVDPERLVVIEERRQRTDVSPRARFQEAFAAAMWGPQHWAGRPIIGWPDEIRRIDRDALAAFFAAHYAPANCVLVVAGAVPEAEFRRIAEQEFGAVPARPFTQRHRAPPPAAAHTPRLIRHDRVEEASLVMAWAAPSLTWGDTTQALPLEVLAHILGSGPGSRLHRALVQEGLALSVGASMDADALGVSDFSLYAAPRRGIAPARVEAALRAAVATLLADGVTEAEVARSTRQMTAGALLALDGLGAAPRMIGQALSIGLALDAVEYWPAHIAAVTAMQVSAAARAVLGGTQVQATGWLLPEGTEVPA